MKTLIIQTAFLGDVVLTLPLIQAIKKNLKSEISVLCIPATKNILEGHPDISEIIVYDKKGMKDIEFQDIDLDKNFIDYNLQHDLTDVGLEKFVSDWKTLIT